MEVQIESITCDGDKSLLKATRKVCPQVIVQRCLVHIQRQTKIWITRSPKSIAGIELKSIINQIHTIVSHEQWGYWVVDLFYWHEKHKEYLNERTINQDTGRYWYTHKMVRRAFMTIKRALPNMFHYLDNPRVPKTTNGLESFFGHLKSNIGIHKGLSKEHHKNYIRWYLFFKNENRFS